MCVLFPQVYSSAAVQHILCGPECSTEFSKSMTSIVDCSSCVLCHNTMLQAMVAPPTVAPPTMVPPTVAPPPLPVPVCPVEYSIPN